MQETRLRFEVRTAGEWSADGAQTTLDGIPVSSADQISLGRHRFEIRHPKAATFSTNLFIWYGGRDLGTIRLERARANLKLTLEPPAREVVVVGPDWRVELTNSQGMTSSVPTDTYAVEARWNHYQQSARVVVNETSGGSFWFVPPLGAVRLASTHPDTTFVLLNAAGEFLARGNLPETVYDLPAGGYQLQTQRRGQQLIGSLAVKAASTNEYLVKFEFAAITLETDPPGATVVSANGENLGRTPLTIPEVPAGTWNGNLRLDGYFAVPVSLSATPGLTNSYRTNLVNIEYAGAMLAARHSRDDGDWERALASAVEALKIRPDDPQAKALAKEASLAQLLKTGKSSTERGDYAAARQAAEKVLKIDPANPEARTLLKDLEAGEGARKHEQEAAEGKRQERLNVLKQSFALALEGYKADADYFETYELQSGLSVGDVEAAVMGALQNQEPRFAAKRKDGTGPETFLIFAAQESPEAQRRCLIAGAQIAPKETRLMVKVLEYKAERKVGLRDFLNSKETINFIPLHPSRVGDLTPNMKSQISEGKRVITETLTRAIGGYGSR